MKREEIFQTIIRCTDASSSPMHRALYAYAVKRKFPSTEVIYNKLSEMHGQDLPPEPKFDELTEGTKVTLTIFRGVAELLEPFADEPIEAFEVNVDGGSARVNMPVNGLAGLAAYEHAGLTSADMQAGDGASLGKSGIEPEPDADMSDGTTPMPPDVDDDEGFEQPNVGDTELTKATLRKK